MFGAHHLYAFCVVQSLNDNWCPVFTEILPIAKITFFFSVLTRVFFYGDSFCSRNSFPMSINSKLDVLC